MVASYAFQSLNPREQAKCQIKAQAKRQVAQEEANCLRNGAYTPNQQRMWPNQYNQNRQAPVPSSNVCVAKVQAAIETVVNDVAKNVMKPFIWNNAKLRQHAARVAEETAKRTAEILEQEKAEDIAKAINKIVQVEMKQLPNSGWVRQAVSKIAAPLLKRAVLLAVNPICQSTGCCTPTSQAVNALDIQQEIAYAFADESEVDPSPYPFIPKNTLPQPCLQRLERVISKGIAKIAFEILVLDREMSHTERVHIADQIARMVRESVQQAEGPAGNGQLKDTIIEQVEQVFPNGSAERLFKHVVRRLIPLTLLEFEKQGCRFPSTNQQNHN
jgi:dihydroneopterin aldolase